MTPQELIYVACLMELYEDDYTDFDLSLFDLSESSGVQDAFEYVQEHYGEHWGEVLDDFRYTGDETDIEAPGSRHYECTIVVRKINGVWVAWPYWYGGGKHGEPGAVDWLGDAFFVEMVEEQRVVQVFKRIGEETN